MAGHFPDSPRICQFMISQLGGMTIRKKKTVTQLYIMQRNLLVDNIQMSEFVHK